jgi:hypothetical protein
MKGTEVGGLTLHRAANICCSLVSMPCLMKDPVTVLPPDLVKVLVDRKTTDAWIHDNGGSSLK